MKRHWRLGFYLILTLGLSLAAPTSHAKFDKASVRNIDVHIDSENLDQFKHPVSETSLIEKTARNLTDAEFPVRKSGGTAFTHTLSAHLSRITHQGTPVGFSFSLGRSNPRDSEFQKTDVLTVHCVLTANQDSKPIAKESREFASNMIADTSEQALLEALAEDVSTVCYEILDRLHLDQPDANSASEFKRPRWMPNLRIEIKNVPPTIKSSNPSAPKKAETAVDAEADDAETTDEDTKKELIIHNQGTPVIIKFGHERR